MKRIMSVVAVLVMVLGLTIVNGCSSGAQVSDSDISNQVGAELNQFKCMGMPYTFLENFDIISISVKDKMVKDKELTAIFNVTVRAKNPYEEGGFGCWSNFIGKGWRINKGETKSFESTFSFNKFDKGWRLVKNN